MNRLLIIVLIAAGIVAAAYGAYRLGMSRGMQMSAVESTSPATTPQTGANVDPAAGKQVLYWHDPMVPGQKFDKPGKSPFMDMQLVPVYADGDSDSGNVTISPRMQQNLGVRTAEVTSGTLTQKLEAAGSISYNDRDVAVVTARVGGFVERLFARAALDPVRKGQPLAEMYVPDWIAAQEEYLSVKRMQGQGTEALVAAARQRMLLAGMSEDQVRSIEAGNKVQPRFTLSAPIGGVIAELGVREGMTVAPGALLFRINGLGTVWIYAEVPESRAGSVRPGGNVEARTPALPGQVFKGRVAALLPEVNATTRTVKARIEVANPGGRLTPGMFASVDFAPVVKDAALLVPSEAVIQTGQRKVVIVQLNDGTFQPTDVETGVEASGQTEIRKGLSAGQKVVISSQFLIDSESSLKGVTTRMAEMPAAGEAATKVHRGNGKIEAINKDAVTISHEPIPSLQWRPMTMEFKAPATGLPKNISQGSAVAFEFRRRKDGQFELTTVAPAMPATSMPAAKALNK